MDKILIGITALLFGVGTLFLVPRKAQASETMDDETDDTELKPITIAGQFDYRGRDDLPRGVRNNNPGNIEDTGIEWVGLVGNDGRYAIFIDTLHGIRAMMIDIYTGFMRDNENTVRKIIREWAPPNENLTTVYITRVAAAMRVSPDQTLQFHSSIIPMAKAIAQHENGIKPNGRIYTVPYPDSLYAQALKATGK